MAKFKVGDRVMVISGNDVFKKGVITPEEAPWKGWFVVTFEDGSKKQIPSNIIALANAVRNARRITSSDASKLRVGEKVMIDDDMPAWVVENDPDMEGVTIKDRFGGRAFWKYSDFDHYTFTNAARSRNAVVQKALNAVARNEYQFKDMSGKVIRTGDTVEWFDKTYKVKALSAIGGRPYDEATLEEAGGRTFVKPTHELRLVGNADTGVLRETAVNGKFKVGDKVVRQGDRPGRVWTIVRADNDHADSWWITDGIIDRTISEKFLAIANSTRTTNAVVAKALNASRVARNGYVVLRTASGGTARVYEGEEVEYDGKSYKAAALGSPSMAEATLVDGAGNKIVVRMRDPRLKAKASNAVEARYATPVGG